RATVDARGRYGNEEASVEACVARAQRAIAGMRIQSHASQYELGPAGCLAVFGRRNGPVRAATSAANERSGVLVLGLPGNDVSPECSNVARREDIAPGRHRVLTVRHRVDEPARTVVRKLLEIGTPWRTVHA